MKETPTRKINLDLENSIFSHDRRVRRVRSAFLIKNFLLSVLRASVVSYFLRHLAWTAMPSQPLSLDSSEFHPKRLERFELFERLELYFARED
jgi:hypothetical protein